MTTQGPDSRALLALTYLGGVTDHISKLADQQREAVALAREHGASWRMIGVALGTSGQAAWERFRPVDPSQGIRAQEFLPMEISSTEFRGSVAPGPQHSELVRDAGGDDSGT